MWGAPPGPGKPLRCSAAAWRLPRAQHNTPAAGLAPTLPRLCGDLGPWGCSSGPTCYVHLAASCSRQGLVRSRHRAMLPGMVLCSPDADAADLGQGLSHLAGQSWGTAWGCAPCPATSPHRNSHGLLIISPNCLRGALVAFPWLTGSWGLGGAVWQTQWWHSVVVSLSHVPDPHHAQGKAEPLLKFVYLKPK